MQRTTLNKNQIPTIGNTGTRISPYRSTGLYMEMHKLDYKKKNLINRLNKINAEKSLIEEKLRNLDLDLKELQQIVDEQQENLVEPEKREESNTQKLKY